MNAPEKVRQYDRATQTVGNIVHLEHFNCCIDDQRLAVLFYVVGLGATRDPYIFTGLENIWLNFGRTQIHMPSRAVPPKAERLRGTAGIVVPSLADLGKLPEYDGHHIQVYIADFGTPYEWLKERDLITMETDANEWRFQWIVDPRDASKLFQIEHEVRSMKHHLFNRPLVNRNHGVTNMTYQYGQDAFKGVT